jgi:hypothetical protein
MRDESKTIRAPGSKQYSRLDTEHESGDVTASPGNSLWAGQDFVVAALTLFAVSLPTQREDESCRGKS